jgi:TolB-like protein
MKLKRILMLLLLIFILSIPSLSTTQTRDPIKTYRVAILPFLIHSEENLDYLREGIYDILASRISVEGRIEVIDRSIIERAFYEERPMRLDEAVAKKIGMKAGADYVILGSLTKIGDYISLDARLLSITEEKPPLGAYTQHKGIDDVMVKIGDFAQDIGYKILGRRVMAGRQTEPKHPYLIKERGEIGRIGSEELGFKKSQVFDIEIRGIDIGDVDGDKKNELVIMDSHNLYIFKYDGDKLKLIHPKIEFGNEHNFLTLDVADVNRNGYAEIIVTSVAEDDLRSFILEYEEGKIKKITEKAGWYFRVLDHPKDGPALMGQRMGSEGVFSGPIYKFVWKKKSFEKGPQMPFPKAIKVFGLAMADIRGQGRNDIVMYNDSERIRVVSPDEKFIWGDRYQYGGSEIYYETPKKTGHMLGIVGQKIDPARIYIPNRIIIKDLDGDGLNEVIVNKNNSTTIRLFDKIRVFDSGEIYNLVWEDGGLITNWKTKEIKGYISDFQVKDVDNDGEVELVVSVMPHEEGKIGAFSSKSKSSILFFKLF